MLTVPIALNRTATLCALLGSIFAASLTSAQTSPTRDEANRALQKAVAFFDQKVSIDGGYLWRYSADLSVREGEDKATATQAWVQPPGTPAVGEAYLTAYERTQEKYLLDAAVHTARALVQGQLHSGGWEHSMEFDLVARKKYAYRVDGPLQEKTRNSTSLDDKKTQSAIQFLMHVDRALDFKDPQIHESTQYALNGLLLGQFPSGGWSQQFSGAPRAADYPVVKAGYPETWPRNWPSVPYTGYYTLNDNALADAMATLFEAAEIYKEPRYFEAAKRGGDFLILAQMPDPQPAWAQQYNPQMQPAWARKFEPPAVTGGESQGAIKILMAVYRETGEKKYLEPIPRALDYLDKSALPSGRLARFYELKTNKPLFFTKDYQLVYSDADVPTHYSFDVPSNLRKLRSDYEKILVAKPEKLKPAPKPAAYALSPELTAAAKAAIAFLDSRGAWLEPGRLKSTSKGESEQIITTATFIKNLATLSEFISASK